MAEGSGRWRERECERDCDIRHEESGRRKIDDRNNN